MNFPDPSSSSNGSLGAYLSAILYTGKCLGYEKKPITGAAAVALAAVPANARLAVCVLEADASLVGQARVARYREDGVADPTAAEGMPVGDNGVFELTGDNITAFRMISMDPAKTHNLRVQYYGSN